MKIKQQIAYGVEIVWMILSIVSLGIGVFETYRKGISISYIFFIISLVSILMYLFRRHLRLNKNKADE